MVDHIGHAPVTQTGRADLSRLEQQRHATGERFVAVTLAPDMAQLRELDEATERPSTRRPSIAECHDGVVDGVESLFEFLAGHDELIAYPNQHAIQVAACRELMSSQRTGYDHHGVRRKFDRGAPRDQAVEFVL